jgi:tripeptide aminopeptidase
MVGIHETHSAGGGFFVDNSQTKAAPYVFSDEVTQTYEALWASAKVQHALQFIQTDHPNTVDDQIRITEIPAPSFQEEARKAYYQTRLQELGLQAVITDSEGNVFGTRPGRGDGPRIFVSAHLDTVFPEGTNTTVKRHDGKLYAPGISDDGRGLTVVLAVIRALDEANIETHGDIIFGATVGEEGLGDLRGVKAFFRDQRVDGFISIEPDSPARATYLATGSHRYRITYQGPGGHSFGAFGTPSAIHALGRAIAMISDITVPDSPKTTFTIGTVSGGTSVNTIAAAAEMMIDIRSNAEEELLKLEDEMMRSVQMAVDEENSRWNQTAVTVKIELVGNRPAGTQPADAIIVQAAMASSQAIGFEPALDDPSSTDANVPIHLGIPAVTLGGGGGCGGMHTLEEFFDPTDAYLGVQNALLTVLGLVGVQGVAAPLLSEANIFN